ncbi:hypothetical protein V6N12_059491 [Hibiscus sabdariffa]|uniref:Phosphoglycerate mutase family protein n=1 Tax=Hibiscus sabdariffa TaxID=183260 RepID=A0ABR2EV88_9ROSI
MGRMGALCNSFVSSFQTPIFTRIKTRHKQPLVPRRNLNLKAMAMDPSDSETYHQNVLVMRHGDRLDNFDPTWEKTADRPWDPPLIQTGLSRAFQTGRAFRTLLPFPIHRVFVSPFLRCVQTASEVVAALCAVDDDPNAKSSRDVVSIDPSKVKASIEYGLCEMLNTLAISLDVAPKDGIFRFDIPKLEALLPNGTLDRTVEPVYKEMPQWGETMMDTQSRHEQMIKALADKYPSENLLLVTHWEGVAVSVSSFKEDTGVSKVAYCGYSELRRPVSWENQTFTAGNFEHSSAPVLLDCIVACVFVLKNLMLHEISGNNLRVQWIYKYENVLLSQPHLQENISPSKPFRFHKEKHRKAKATAMDSSETKTCQQNVLVMRHGDRLDNFDPTWEKTADRPWDPPLIQAGLSRAFKTGRAFQTLLPFPIHRVFVSPFLRCVQTASEVVAALCAVDDHPDAKSSSDVVSIDPSKLKVSIEYGLCEMLNTLAIRRDVAPKDGIFHFDVPKLEALLPSGTLDPTVEPVYKEVPQWGETDPTSRYEQTIKALADTYPTENLLLVTHGEGVSVSVSSFLEDITVIEVDYCAYSELRRPVSWRNASVTAGNFELDRDSETDRKENNLGFFLISAH